MKKTFIAGILVGAGMLITGVILSQIMSFVLPAIKTQYQNPALFRPWSDPIMSIYYLVPFILGTILVWLWKKYLGLTGGVSSLGKGVRFALIYWVIGIPGMVISYSTFPVSILMVVSWSLSSFVQLIVAGLILYRLWR